MVEYLTPDHPDAFVDFPKRKPEYEYKHECPVCKGHGGWNLYLNSYKLPAGMEDTAENRNKYVHFCASCSQCNGWGYTREPTTCIHSYDRELGIAECKERDIYHAGRCYHVYECSQCGKMISQDSSD